ncbi:MAG TPA: oligopeptide/dipeptide ABC transporter ATP-binding protein [Steroidobacteraceae bacterium]|nr:oligopeptide/dipeptide ABC transporter ATP-binding protein [Steroidobacteraceae bacterium]
MTGPRPPLLEVRELRVRYRGQRAVAGAPTDAVAGVGFDIGAGESVGLVGESGSGKSSIARALLRLVPATGSVRFEGQELLALRGAALRAVRERMQIVFQDPIGALDPHMTVQQLVTEPLLEFRAALRTQHAQQAQAMLARVGLGTELLARHPHQLSGGQAQRVGLARALILGPRLLLCDEPVASLDVSIRSQIVNLLHDMRAELGLALLFIAHDLPAVRFLCDRVLVLFRGRIVEQAPREALFGAPQHPYTRALLAANPVPDPARRPSAPPPAAAPAAAPGAPPPIAGGCAYRDRCPLAVARCTAEAPAMRAVGASLVACHRAGE